MNTRPDQRHWHRAIGLASIVLLASGAAAGQLAAQASQAAPAIAPTVVPVQALLFETLLPGAEVRVPVTDDRRRAEWRLEGGEAVDVLVILPDALIGPHGAGIPLTFRHGDVVVMEGNEARPVPPHQPFPVRLRPEGVRLLVGGSALPALDDLAGEYTANIQVLVMDRRPS